MRLFFPFLCTLVLEILLFFFDFSRLFGSEFCLRHDASLSNTIAPGSAIESVEAKPDTSTVDSTTENPEDENVGGMMPIVASPNWPRYSLSDVISSSLPDCCQASPRSLQDPGHGSYHLYSLCLALPYANMFRAIR